jgi:hypothetical protein
MARVLRTAGPADGGKILRTSPAAPAFWTTSIAFSFSRENGVMGSHLSH